MEHTEYKKMYDLESTYWWYVGRRAIIDAVLGMFWHGRKGRIVDVGCGTGINLGLLKKYSSNVIGMDTAPEALEYSRARGFSNVTAITQEYQLPVQDNSISLVTMLDVLEHVEDEAKMLQEVRRVLEISGLLLMTVPAYQFLWSEHDVALHHKRRYTARRLKKILREHGFAIKKVSYCITFSFPIILCYRIIKGFINYFYKRPATTSHVQLPYILNAFFIMLLSLEAKFIRLMSFPFGTSIILVAEKN